MGAHRKSIIKESIERFDSLMAIGQSRGQAKRTAREAGTYSWAFTTGKIHSHKTRQVYQEQTLRFVAWARQHYQVKTLDQLIPRADELVTLYPQQQIAEQKSPSTLHTERAALRLFFGMRTLADIALPPRLSSNITRSRYPVEHDRHFQLANWQSLLGFLEATGLRRQELHDLKNEDIYQAHDGSVYVYVENGKGGRERNVPVLPGHEQDVLSAKRSDDQARVFERIPKHLDVHAYRRKYAQALYLHYVECNSPFHQAKLPPAGRLKASDYDLEAVQRVSWALGHNRTDVVLRHYLR
jgi:hypothetical protein